MKKPFAFTARPFPRANNLKSSNSSASNTAAKTKPDRLVSVAPSSTSVSPPITAPTTKPTSPSPAMRPRVPFGRPAPRMVAPTVIEAKSEPRPLASRPVQKPSVPVSPSKTAADAMTPKKVSSIIAGPRATVGGAMGGPVRGKAGLSLPELPLDVQETVPHYEFEQVNTQQVRYDPLSQVNVTGAVIPKTMAGPTRAALEKLEAKVGNIDDWLCERLQWTSLELGLYLSSEQADAVALSIDSADRGEGLIIADQTGFGKGRSQPLDALILTPSGWVPMGEIKVGDDVVSVDGNPTKVTGIFPQGEIEIYEIEFSDGAKTRCSGDHLWSTLTRNQRHSRKYNPSSKFSDYKVRTTADLANRIDQRHSIPLVAPINFEVKSVEIDPWLLGVLLGDASICERSVDLVAVEQEIIDGVLDSIPDGLVLKPRGDRGIHFGIVKPNRSWKGKSRHSNPLVSALRRLGVTGKGAAEKFIPDDYIFNTVDIRLAVLQGLMDTDGTATKGGTSQFSSASKKLADAVCFIARSLGGTATQSIKKTKRRPAHMVSIRLPNGMNPFRLSRKKERVTKWSKYPPVRLIRSIRSAGRALAQCISVAHESRLYVTDDCIVTHNTIAAAARARILNGYPVIFLTEKANLFADFWRDIRDIGSEELFGRPFMLNDNAQIIDTSSETGEVLVPKWKKADVKRVLDSGEIPGMFMMATYSQFNRKGTKKSGYLEQVAPGCHMILDEAHNFVGDSNTSKTVGGALETAASSTFSSATFARDVTNLRAYSSVFPWLAAIPDFEDYTPAQKRALAEESTRIATEAGRIIRREHDLSNMVLRVEVDEKRRDRNEEYADKLAPILSKMAVLARKVDKMLMERNENNQEHLETLASASDRKDERENWFTANFGSRLNAIIGQFLVALEVDPCVDKCIEALKNGQKPVVVIETTMESLMRELAKGPEAEETDSELGDDGPILPGLTDEEEEVAEDESTTLPPTFKNALAIMTDRLLKVSVRRGADYEKEEIILDDEALVKAQQEIIALVNDYPDISLSPIDDIRDRVEAAGKELFEKGEIEKAWVADEISARGMKVENGQYVKMAKQDRNTSVARFVNGGSDCLVITRAASTGLSIHDSEKFTDHKQRHMIELRAPRNVIERVQTWGRVFRRGQRTEPEFTTLSTGLPFQVHEMAMQNQKVAELCASVTGTGESLNTMDVLDPIDGVGNDVAYDFLVDNPNLAEHMGIPMSVDRAEADKEFYFVAKLLRRLPLLGREEQTEVFESFMEAYLDRLKSGVASNTGLDLEGNWTPIKRELLEPGDGSDDPVSGRDVVVTTLRSVRHTQPLNHDEIADQIKEATERLGKNPFAGHIAEINQRGPDILKASLPANRFETVQEALRATGENAVKKADSRLSNMTYVLKNIAPGIHARLPNDDGEPADSLVIDVRIPDIENAAVAREYMITYMQRGDEKVRTMSLDAMIRNPRFRLGDMSMGERYLKSLQSVVAGEVDVIRKVIGGNGIGAVLASRRYGFGTRTSYLDDKGQVRTGILVPKAMELKLAGQLARTNLPDVAMAVFENGGRIQTDPISPSLGVEIRMLKNGKALVIIPGGKRNAKPFETEDMLAVTGNFDGGDWRGREAEVAVGKIPQVLGILKRKGFEFYFEAGHRRFAYEKTLELSAANDCAQERSGKISM